MMIRDQIGIIVKSRLRIAHVYLGDFLADSHKKEGLISYILLEKQPR